MQRHQRLKGKSTIRSFVLRSGRMTLAQKKALVDHWPERGLSIADGLLDSVLAFGRRADTVLEIGFGMGCSLITMAKANPEKNFIGIDVYKPGVGKLLHSMAMEGVNNIRIYCDDAVQVIKHCIPKQSLARIHIYFPDPWPKKKHHKRRLIQFAFVQQLHDILRLGGVLHLATDWEPYAQHMLEVLSLAKGFQNQVGNKAFSGRPSYRPMTPFEQRGQCLGHGSWDLLFIKAA